jgi:hypothetical protein
MQADALLHCKHGLEVKDIIDTAAAAAAKHADADYKPLVASASVPDALVYIWRRSFNHMQLPHLATYLSM